MMTNAMLSPLPTTRSSGLTLTQEQLIFFSKSAHSNCSRKLFFSNFCMVRSKLKSFELSFGANSDSSAYTKISQTVFQMASQTAV
jgi:hypothetical protein